MRVGLLVTAALIALPAGADEGMWTLDNFPRDKVAGRYGVEIDESWLRQVQLASTRLEGGCSGSFVSPQGLVLTNHHCVSECLQQMSSADNDVAQSGFLAATREEEVQCQSEQVSVLVDMENVTNRVREATRGISEEAANEARKRVLTDLEAKCEAEQELSCESVDLYHGGQYWLYKYERYSDVRMVFVPEARIAAFGGDPDNFNFPRWCLDMALLRVYRNGEPATTPDFLSWRPEGAQPGEVVFVSGHPGATSRLLTVAELEHLRNVVLPSWLLRYSELRGRMIQYAKTGEEAARIVQTPLMMLENGIKVQRHRHAALLNEELFARKREEEIALRTAIDQQGELAANLGDPWRDMAAALERYRSFYDEYLFLESSSGFYSDLFSYARTLVRATVEMSKPNEERLREYTQAALPLVEQRLLAAQPVYADLELLTLSYSLDKMREILGPDSVHVQRVLGDDSPEAFASQVVGGSQLGDPVFRRQLWDGGHDAVFATSDPMIALARKIDPEARRLRKQYENEVEAVLKAGSEKIARARFAIQGTQRYPDATFTLRVTFGAVEGWQELNRAITPFTATSRLYERATGEDPFRVPESWMAKKGDLDPGTRFNFVATTDIVGGNSGSPVIDRNGRLVGLAFDGNIHSIAGDYWFDPSMNRTVAVHPAIMLEALGTVYGADRLLEELGVKQ